MSLVIDDAHVDTVKQYLTEQCQNLDYMMRRYVRTMNKVIETGIMEGETAESLREFVNQVESSVKTKNISPELMGSQAERFCTNFVKKVDKADKDLY